MHTERALTEGRVYHVDDSFRDIGHISVSRRGSGETLHDVVAEVRIRAIVVLGLACLIYRRTGMREVVGAGGEGPRNDDGGLDAPTIQLCRIADSERIHSGLRREVGRKIRRRASARTGASHPENQALLLLA